MKASISIFAAVCLLASCLLTRPVAAQIVRPETSNFAGAKANEAVEPSNGAEREVAELIAKLGSASFQTREQATSRLLEIGQPALGQLNELAGQDLEVRLRATQVAMQIESRQFEVLSRSFLLDTAPENSYGFPAWRPFSALVGHSRTSKLLFLDMIRLHPRLIEIIDSLSRSAAPSAKDHMRLERMAATISAELASNRLSSMQVAEIGDFTAILFATSYMAGQAPIEVNEWLLGNAYQVPVTSYMRRRGYGPALRRLYAAWIPKTHASMGARAIEVSLRYGLETGAVIARKNLAPNLDVRTREHAIHCLARFGNRSDIAPLSLMLDDETIVQEFAGNQLPLSFLGRIEESNEHPPGLVPQELDPSNLAIPSIVRINDLALATICLLAEEEPESIFPGFLRHETYGFDSRSIAVAKLPQAQADRRELINQWKRRFSRSAG